ncbi:MAG: dTMP kinase [Deltaproteobacteria bacterium]|nr:dTMP kinase [Deltaproteobacteria bacterium]
MSYFITLEGIEGCGKSTQIPLLKEYLEKNTSYKVLVTREPGGSPIADQIRKILLSRKNKALTPQAEVFLYEASRAQHVAEVIKPALKQKKIVLCDRFMDATTVYQGIARNLGEKLCKDLNHIATKGLTPHLTLILDCDVKIGLARSRTRLQKENKDESRLEEESLNFHKKVREGYLKLAQEDKNRFRVMNANQTIEAIHKDICKEVLSCLRKQASKNTGSPPSRG